MSDVRIERVVERVWLCVGTLGPEQRKEPRYEVAYHTYLASGRRCLTHWPLSAWSVEIMPNTACKFGKFSQLADYAMLTWEKILGSPRFLYCKQRKAGRGLGRRLTCTLVTSVLHSRLSSLLCHTWVVTYTSLWVLCHFAYSFKIWVLKWWNR